MRFLGLRKIDFLWAKKVSFPSITLLNIISSLILTENNSRKKTTFFDQKHGLTPLEKCDFWDLKRLNFLWPKKVSFLSRTLLNIISSLILTENNSRKKTTFFHQKHGLTPLEKCHFWDFERLNFFGPKKCFVLYLKRFKHYF